jgi:hypothetical protein
MPFVGFTHADDKCMMVAMIAPPISSCPFCASNHAHCIEIDKSGWAVVCNGCGGIGPVGISEADAIDQWGRRFALAKNLGLLQNDVKCPP